MKDNDELPVFTDLPVHLSSNQTQAAGDVTSSSDVTMIAFVVFTCACIVATIIGNILVVLSIFTYRPLRGVQNYYIVSLACADLAVAVFVMPFNVADSLAGYWQFGAVFCNMWLTFDILMCTASILNLCAIAGDRFFAIHDPINYAQKRTLHRVLVVIAIVWTASAVISIPPLFGWNNSSPNSSSLYDEVNRSCQLTDEPGFVLYSASGSFYIPLVIMAFLYAKIYRATRKRLRKRSSTSIQPRPDRRTGHAVDDSPKTDVTPLPNHNNGSIQLGKTCHDRGAEKSDRPVVDKSVKDCGELLPEAGKRVEGKDGKGQTQTEEERRPSTSRSDNRKSLKRDGDTLTLYSVRHSTCDGVNKNGGDTAVTKPSDETKNNDCSRENTLNKRNGRGSVRDGNGNVGDGNKVTDDGNGDGNDSPGDGNNPTGGVTQKEDETLERGRYHVLDRPPSTTQQRSNGATSKRTRSRTKNSLKITSSLPRRSPKPQLTVSILNTANNTQTENWSKAETSLRPVSMRKPMRWNSMSPSPDCMSRAGSSRLSQILENRQKISLSKERRAARTMAVVMGAFVLCWLPFFLMYVIFPFCESCRKNTDRRVKNFIVWLGYVNSALNPVIYTIFNIDFRRAFKSLLQGNCKIIA